MTSEGWDHIPHGYGAGFDVAAAPWWLRLWFHAPFVDRYAYPLLGRRGFAHPTPSPDARDEDRDPVGGGWRLREPGYTPPGSTRGRGRRGR